MKNQKGFATLLELILVIALVSIIMVLLTTVFLSQSKTFNTQKSQIEVEVSNRFALDEMTSKLRESTGLLSQAVVDGQTYTTNDQTVVAQIPAVDASSEIIFGKFDTLIYTLNSSNPKQLLKILSPDLASSRTKQRVVLANDVSSLQFSYNNADLALVDVVKINFSSSKSVAGTSPQTSDKASVTLRNK